MEKGWGMSSISCFRSCSMNSMTMNTESSVLPTTTCRFIHVQLEVDRLDIGAVGCILGTRTNIDDTVLSASGTPDFKRCLASVMCYLKQPPSRSIDVCVPQFVVG